MKSSNGRDEPLLLFLHIRKAGGTTLKDVIVRHYGPEAILRFELSHMNLVRDGYEQLSDDGKARLRAVVGQMPFGLHEFLPNPSTYITMLRDPLSRVVSYFGHVRRNPQHEAHEEVMGRRMTLRDFVCSGVTTEVDNGQVRTLCGTEHVLTSPAFGECSEGMLEDARRNLDEHFRVVGLLERFDETLILMKRAFGWRNVLYVRKNVSPNRESERIDQATLDEIVRRNSLDIQLYEHVKRKFEETIRNQPSGFAAELRSLRRLNALYGIKPLRYAASKIRALVR